MSERQAHALFLPENEGDELLTEDDIGCISIMRIGPSQESAGKTFTTAELPDPGAILRLFGGGTYKVQARSISRQIIKGGTRHYTFRGESFPMTGEGPPAKAPDPVVHHQAPQAPQVAPMDLTPIATMMNSQMQIFVKLFEGQQSFSQELVRTLGARTPAAEGGNDVDTLLRGMELGQKQVEALMEMRNAMEEKAQEAAGVGGDDLTSTITAVTNAVGTFAAMKGQKKGPPAPSNGGKLPPAPSSDG